MPPHLKEAVGAVRPMLPFDVRPFSFRVNRTGTGCHAYVARDPALLLKALRNRTDLGTQHWCIESLEAATGASARGLRMVMPRANVAWQAHTKGERFDWQVAACPHHLFEGRRGGRPDWAPLHVVVSVVESIKTACTDVCRSSPTRCSDVEVRLKASKKEERAQRRETNLCQRYFCDNQRYFCDNLCGRGRRRAGARG
jgi:hypothetical protein